MQSGELCYTGGEFRGDDLKKYEPAQIPPRVQGCEDEVESQVTSPSDDSSGFLPFAEIEMRPTSVASESSQFSGIRAQAIDKTLIDKKRLTFYAMRQIAKIKYSIITDEAKLFYKQAVFMKDFEDDCRKRTSFSSYFPKYQAMTYEHFRTYFTWRTKVRKGRVEDTSATYAFLYVYELLLNIGVDSPQEGLDKLMDFWYAFRLYGDVLNKYMLQWLKDYHVYYELPKSFEDFAIEHNLRVCYPPIFAYGANRRERFEILIGISSYDIRNSIFYTKQTSKLIHDCFDFVFNGLCQLSAKAKYRFEDIVFYPVARESPWKPFNRALFHPALKQPDRQVVFSDAEVYTCRNNNWTHSTVLFTDDGRELIGYIMREMEISLRKIFQFKHKISSKRIMCRASIHEKLDLMGFSLNSSIINLIMEFYRELTRTEIVVDVDNLVRIRKEALHTQKKLIVSDEMAVVMGKTPASKPTSKSKSKQTKKSASKPALVDIAEAVEIAPLASGVGDIWASFKECLTQTELDALSCMLQAQDVKVFANEKRIMLEVLVDEINQKAVDCIHDTILEFSDTVILYEDYVEKIKEMVEC